jgi:hypothetical protein
MSAVSRLANRRRILKGMLGGGAVTLGLPFLDAFLNDKGTALAATGQKLPTCFGTWFQGLGLNPGYWEPKASGANYPISHQLKPLERFKDKINVYSGMRVILDGHAPKVHNTGAVAVMSGGIPEEPQAFPSIDNLIADHIGTRTRFRSLEASSNGSRESYSRRSRSALNPSDPSPVAMYTRIFGPDFRDPNAAEFTPDPAVMARKSVLSAFGEERKTLLADLGASDRSRIDEYFTALRELESRLELELQKPAPLEACSVPKDAKAIPAGLVIDDIVENNKLFSKLVVHALACGQTRVVNMLFDGAGGNCRRAASPVTFHIHTHEEPVDPAVGYQPNVHWFMETCLTGLATYLGDLQSVKEGDQTLLDRIVIMFGTDTGFAKFHSMENIPMFTFGGAGGRMKTGIHVPCNGDTTSRVGLTIQQALGVPVNSWGTESNQTSKTITEVMA